MDATINPKTSSQKPPASSTKKERDWSKITLRLLTLGLALGLAGCGYYSEERNRLTQWWLEETHNWEKAYTPEEVSKMPYNSPYAKDYIGADGVGVAIPAKADYDLYISPFAPDRYFRSKRPAGSAVWCPYTARPLILGKRGEVAERTAFRSPF